MIISYGLYDKNCLCQLMGIRISQKYAGYLWNHWLNNNWNPGISRLVQNLQGSSASLELLQQSRYQRVVRWFPITVRYNYHLPVWVGILQPYPMPSTIVNQQFLFSTAILQIYYDILHSEIRKVTTIAIYIYIYIITSPLHPHYIPITSP